MKCGDRKLRLSINPGMIDKNAAGDVKFFVDGWENTEVPPAELARHVTNGIAYCAQLQGPRKGSNFLASDVVSVDVDGGLTIEQALAEPLVRDHALLLYTTVSHTPEQPRFRIVFATHTTVTDPKKFSALARSLALRNSGDNSAVDATRICYGSTGAEVHMLGNALSETLQAELIAQSARIPQSHSSGDPVAVATPRSAVFISPDEVLRTSAGSSTLLADAKPGTRIFCPRHADGNASAFVVESERGVRGLHCSTCVATYWPPSTARYDFDSFEKAVRAARRYFEEHRDWGPFYPVPDPHVGLSETTVTIAKGQPAPRRLQRTHAPRAALY